MATEYKSPLPGLLDYIVPDRLEQQAISAFARNPNPMNEQGQPLYGNFRPNIDPNNPQGLNNIETLFGTAYMPQAITYSGGGPTNKQMIDAAILRAGLEMGKGRQPGETFGGALARGAEAAGQPAKTLAAAQAAAAKARGTGTQLGLSKPELTGISATIEGLAISNKEIGDKLQKYKDNLGDILDTNRTTLLSIATEVGQLQNIYKDAQITDLIPLALDNLLGNKSSAPSSNSSNDNPDEKITSDD